MRIISSATSDLVTDQRVHRFCKTLHQNGYEILLVGREKETSPALGGTPYRTLRLKLHFERGPLFYLEYNWRLFRLLLSNPADILIANDLDTLAANYLVCFFRRTGLIYDSHEYFTEVPELLNRPFKRFIWRLTERLAMGRVDAGITVSASIAEAMRERYGKPMTVIRNLPEAYDAKRYRDKEKYLLTDPNEFRILLYQGSVNVSRGLEEMIEAMALLPLCKLFIAGDGDVLEDLKIRAAGHTWRDRIVFLGRLDPEELRYYTVQAHLGLSIEKKDGLNYTWALPNKFFDYIQAGVPVLISDLPELVAMNRQYEVAEVIDNHAPEAISHAVLRLFANKEKYDRLQQNTRKAGMNWTWEKESAKLLGVMGQLSGRGG